MAVTLPRPEAAGRDGVAVKSRCDAPVVGEEVPGQHDCFQPGKCGGIL